MRFWRRVFVGAVLGVLLIPAAFWVAVLASSEPLSNPLATWGPWPVACSPRGCITTVDWIAHWEASQSFAKRAQVVEPLARESLFLLEQHSLIFPALAALESHPF